VRAPELARPGIVWLNSPRPLSLAELRGRLVILDSWTSCCVNCMQLQPILAELEARFGDRIAVIGVHSPKFTAERDIDKLAAAIERSGIAHPVAQDVDFTIWRKLVAIGGGWGVASLIGSGLFDFGHENGQFAGALLQHPLALALDGTRLYLADSYTDTVRVAELDPGRIADLDDGFLCQDPLCRAPSEPAGIALAGDRLLLADSNNHRILAYDLAGRTVRTWAE
jgi:thiol-disulfide isomerase/thioredoxin